MNAFTKALIATTDQTKNLTNRGTSITLFRFISKMTAATVVMGVMNRNQSVNSSAMLRWGQNGI